MPSAVPPPREVSQAFHEELHAGRQTALLSWLAFTVTFVVVRVITHRIRGGRAGLHNLQLGGTHLHHYLWGILSVSGVGGVALRGEDRWRRHPLVAIVYGAGLALIVDEFALLLDLKDVYWSEQGRWSVDLAIAVISSAGTLLVGRPVLARLRRNRQG
ncbi:MAG TPA: hypothetical protein VKV06_11060 [Acidimicrobiales bacterium]|nr:hypothetical protein [Acidimicrobiales bacterium]